MKRPDEAPGAVCVRLLNVKEYEYITPKGRRVCVFHYGQTDSTNKRAREYANTPGAYMPSVFIADGQSAGRGRLGRSFDSPEGAGIYISFLFTLTGAVDAGKITAGAAIKVCRAIERFVDIELGIKWVNDVYYGEKKLAGILCEAQFGPGDDTPEYVVVGIGINLKSRPFPPELAEIATTLEDASGMLVSRKDLIKELINEIFEEGDFSSMVEEYKKRSILIGRRVLVMEHSGASCYANVVGISDGAGLIVESAGEVRELFSGEISIKI